MEERERKSVKPDSKQTESAPSGPELVPQADTGDDEANELNVCSEKFDPLLALYAPVAPPLPFPNIKCFNNVAEYESFLKGGRGRAKPENVEKRQRKAMKGVADPERIERLKKLMVNNAVSGSEEGDSSGGGGGAAPRRRRRQKPPKNVLTRMSLCKGSPLGELHRCVEERIRVRVHIRTFKGLRGVCSGFVVAFDKFWNMAMVDVDETYREPLLGEALYHEKALTISRLFEKLSLQENLESCKLGKKREAREKSGVPKSCSARSANTREDGGAAEPKLSGDDEGIGPAKARDPAAHQKMYGKVHTRHINQLFIRGENVILVNPRPF
ncbi:U7 snRNA-associated Sm-like protein LSm11 [Anableps anableps]